jgi:hypothetical protein
MKNKTKNFYQLQTHQHQNQLSGCLPLEGTENSSSQTKEELNTQNHSSKVIIRPIVRAVDGLGRACS